MSINLAVTWYPRGELPRFARWLPLLEEHYPRLAICFIPSEDASIQEHFTSGEYATDSQIIFHINDNRRNGRYLALKLAMEQPADFIHYVDLDRLVHWVETRPQEWMDMLAQIAKAECTIFGRTASAMHTHPQALQTTEVVSNRVVSHFLGLKQGEQMDVSAGSKAFSHRAAQYLLEHGSPTNSIGTDAEWPILMRRAGFSLQYIPVDGLDYESADQHRPRAATAEEQRECAAQYDANPAHWITRVDIADQIIKTALDISRRKVRPK